MKTESCPEIKEEDARLIRELVNQSRENKILIRGFIAGIALKDEKQGKKAESLHVENK